MSDNWLADHGDDLIPVRLVDLLCVVARMEQVLREPGQYPFGGITEERIYTCDLPRLRGYLPAEALRELTDE